MIIAPIKGDLQFEMQVGDRTVAMHQESAPDHRTNLADPYVKPLNLGTDLFCHRCLILANDRQNCEIITSAPGLYRSPLSEQGKESVYFMRATML